MPIKINLTRYAREIVEVMGENLTEKEAASKDTKINITIKKILTLVNDTERQNEDKVRENLYSSRRCWFCGEVLRHRCYHGVSKSLRMDNIVEKCSLDPCSISAVGNN